jgi:sterol 3beta-glucosyltransferase
MRHTRVNEFNQNRHPVLSSNMKIILLSIGTRGDMEPFLAIGEMLKERGHQIICAFPEQFRHLAEDSHLSFASLGPEFIDMLSSQSGKAALGGGGSGLKKMLAYIKLAGRSTEINKNLVYRQAEFIEDQNPDRIVYNGKAVYPIIWSLKNRGQTILISPVPYLHYVRDHTHMAFNSNFGPFFNKLTYLLADFGLITTVMISIKWLKIPERITRKQIRNTLSSRKVIYTISPAVFSRPDDWNENIQILGYPRQNRDVGWQADNRLCLFLKKHKKILFVTFGSMTNPDPGKKTKILLDILRRNHIPAILNTASGGLVRPDRFDDESIYFISRIPYGWILPKVYGVIHHGGSGTTHLALRYGCATLIIPHILDQFVWNSLIEKMGAGPKGMRIDKMTIKNLEPKILELMNRASYRREAEKVARQMVKEDFTEALVHAITD